MATSKIRSSRQLYIDANLDINSNKIVNLADGTDNTDAVTVQQLNTAVNGIVAAADAMVFKGTVGVGGTLEIAAFNALTVYNAGWTYRVITAGTIKGHACEVGDLLISTMDRTSAGVDADWTVAQNNIDGAVIKANYTAQSILAATTSANPVALTIPEQTVVGRITGGNVTALTAAQLRTLINVADGATANTKATGAELDTGTDDTKFATAKAIRDSGVISTAASAEFGAVANKATIVDADQFLIEDSAASYAKKYLTWANVKTVLNSEYWRQTATGDVTISANVTTIGALKVATGMIQNNAVTFAKMQNISTATFLGRNTAATGVVEELSIATVKTMLGITTQTTRTYRATPTGTINGSNAVFTIAANVISGSEEVYLNGILQNAGAGNDYTITYGATTTITFLTAPSSTPFVDVILVNYSV